MGTTALIRMLTSSLFILSCFCPPPESVALGGKQNQVSEVAGEQAPGSFRDRKSPFAPGEVLVKFREGTDEATVKTIQEQLNLKTIRIISKPDLFLMKILDGSPVEEIVQRLRSRPEVSHAEPNFTVEKHSEHPQTE